MVGLNSSSVLPYAWLFKRLWLGTLGGALLLFGLSYNIYTYALFCCIMCFGAQREFYRLFPHTASPRDKLGGIVIGLLLFFYTFCARLEYISWEWGIVFLLLPFLGLLKNLYRPQKESPFENLSVIFFGILYIAVPCAILNFWTLSPEGDHNPIPLLGSCIIIWGQDSGAFIVGRLVGRHPLFFRHSPRKTWEGLLAGVFFSFVAGFLLRYTTGSTIWWCMAPLLSVTSVYGDLIASMLKRHFEVKDTGHSLSSHGGFLDRFDSFLFSVPFVALFYKIYERYEDVFDPFLSLLP
ncbi:MAG: phosphatidate cytidylyltransferase [Cytophagales bacterium]|nr:phosphatidate cytidylyltransferase [Cytophagales bacterium]